MVKLTPPNAFMSSKDESGSAAEKRRKSSLDIKVSNGAKRTTPFGKLRPPQPTTQELQQQREQQQVRPVTSHKTRARSAGGLPSKRPDYRPSLDDLTEEQLQMAMARDPELAAAVKAAAAEMDEEKFKKRSSYYRNRERKDSSFNEHPQHLRAMMEEGIPVTQWIILFVLLGAGLFQLRKVVLGPATEKNAKKAATPRKSPQKAQRKSSKQQKGKRVASHDKGEAPRSPPPEKKPSKQRGKNANASLKSKAPNAVPTLTTEANVETPSSPNEHVVQDNGKDVTAAEPKLVKTAKKKKKSAKKTQSKKENKAENHSHEDGKQPQSPVLASAGGLSAASEVEPSGNSAVENSTADEGDGWHTVRKGSAADKREGKNGSKVNDAVQQEAENDPAMPSEVKDCSEPASTESAQPPLLSPSPQPSSKGSGASDSTNHPAEKVSQSEAMDSVALSALPVASVDDDAALALRLQEEEEKLAKTSTTPAVDDSWAEVAPRKSKRRSAGPEVDTAPTATEAW